MNDRNWFNRFAFSEAARSYVISFQNKEGSFDPNNQRTFASTDSDKYDYIPLLADVNPIECNIWRRVPRVAQEAI
jgi:hypothetical protein